VRTAQDVLDGSIAAVTRLEEKGACHLTHIGVVLRAVRKELVQLRNSAPEELLNSPVYTLEEIEDRRETCCDEGN
jgi:hypothetical protein